MGNLVVPVDERLYSTLKIGTDEFPLALFHDDLRNFARGFVNWHKQREIEISYIREGNLKVCLLNEEHVLGAGSAFIIFPDALHSIQPVGGCCARYTTLIFDPCLLTGFAGSFFERTYYLPAAASSRAYYAFSRTQALEPAFEDLYWLFERCMEPGARLHAQRRLQDVFVALFEHVFDADAGCANPVREERILRMIDYLHRNYAEKFSLTRMAEHLHVSRGECCRFFRRMMGMTISAYLLDYRLSRAGMLLLNTRRSMTDIAHDVGFRSASNFSAEFKKKTGVTPSSYRAREMSRALSD